MTAAAVVHPAYLQHLGETPYREALAEMVDLAAARSQGAVPDTMMLLEHAPVITLGSRADRARELPLSDADYAARGIEVVAVPRGGRSTYHGPGQLVGYPILDLRERGRDVHRYVRGLEQVLIGTLAEYGVEGRALRLPHQSGVWVGDRKIASIGVRCSSWVTSHGFSLNADLDLSVYGLFDACGLGGAAFTSVTVEAGRPVTVDDLREPVVRHLAEVFELTLSELPVTA
ncbi:MAG TPA: lipoyl(octanoyl) transferase LipB [Gaiellales bacterium]|nr:lipoyl(octanoyl) transferase LipB [Gaiellales bacterium]